MIGTQEPQVAHRSHRWPKRLTSALNLALRPLPFARRWIAGSVLDRLGRVERLRDEGNREEAFQLAVRTIPYCLGGAGWRKGVNRRLFWLLLTHAVELVDGFDQQRQVFELLLRPPGAGGAQEATVLEQVSRWYWRAGKNLQAIEVARAAVAADRGWPWAQLTLAFYLQQSKLGDPLRVIIGAVRADPSCWPEIEERFGPELAAAVRAAVPLS
jgi:hypothetical protein